MLLELAEHLLAQGMGDLCVDVGVLTVLVSLMVGDIFNPTTGFEQMNSHRVAQGVDRACLDAGSVGVVIEKLLDLAFLQGSLTAGKEVGPDRSAFPQIAAQQLSGVSP